MALAIAAAGGLAAAAYLDGKYQLRRDAGTLLKMRRAARIYEKAVQNDRISPWYLIADTFARQPKDRAIWTRDRSWSYKEFHDEIVRYAQWMWEQGIRPGDLVSMYLHNSAEFLIIFFATHCIGAGPALINYNLEGKALLHCLDVVQSKLLIVDEDAGCQQRVAASREAVEAAGARIVILDDKLKSAIHSGPVVVPPDKVRSGTKGNWPYALIFTSGTTGMPKGCPFTVSRTWLLGSHTEPSFRAQRGKDCWYSSMPLYHGTGIITTTTALAGGIGVAVAPRFSVSRFWDDVYLSRSTMFIYVGETARYLLAAPPHPHERDHVVRLAYGNGLRPDVWHKLQERFGIPEVGEFFNSSEGVFNLLNYATGPYTNACVGHHGGILRYMLRNVYIPVAIDFETGDIWRDPVTGFAKRTPYEEGGEIIVAVPGKEAFGGYWRNEQATNKRFATNVFAKGDLYYRSGDALRRSPDGHWYFMDRLGDTFRWRSENVATAEVSEVLGHYPSVVEANVYGVSVPGHEGRAGCAALQLSTPPNEAFFSDLLQYSKARLPRYAVPVFLRITEESSHIHNHKQNKVGLRQEGVDPEKVGTVEKARGADKFFWWRPGSNTYEPFSKQGWEGLVGGTVKL